MRVRGGLVVLLLVLSPVLLLVLPPHTAHVTHLAHLAHPRGSGSGAAVPVLQPNPVNVQLRGAQADAWSRAALAALGAPADGRNLQTMRDWYLNEGIQHNYNNPLNLQTPQGGSWAATEDGDPLSIHIQHYPLPVDFVLAFPREMAGYPAITAWLRTGAGLEGNVSREVRQELWNYSGNGYDSIPAAYCPC